EKGSETRCDLALMRGDKLRLPPQFLWDVRVAVSEGTYHLSKQILHRLIRRPLVERRIGFGGKIRRVTIGNERKVKLRAPASHESRGVQIWAHQLGSQRFGFGHCEQIDE